MNNYKCYSNNYLEHSKGRWRKHKYIRVVNGRYYYYDSKLSDPENGITTFTHVRSDKEKSNKYKNKDVKEVDVIQELNTNDLFSTYYKPKNEIVTIENGQKIVTRYGTYNVGYLERALDKISVGLDVFNKKAKIVSGKVEKSTKDAIKAFNESEKVPKVVKYDFNIIGKAMSTPLKAISSLNPFKRKTKKKK